MDPSVHWNEQIAADEEARFGAAAAAIAAMQVERSKRYGTGRALHRKQLLALRAAVEVQGGLPPHAAQGLFATPRSYDARIRLSNGSFDIVSDRKPDVRGLALKLLGVEGEGVFGGPAPSQDFVLINRSVFGFRGPDEFFGLLFAAFKGVPSVLWHFIRTYGLFGGLRRLGALQKSQGLPFAGFAAAPFFSAAPIACGQHAVRVRLLPDAAPGAPPADIVADMIERVRKGPIGYALQLQFFVDDQRTPIEDGTVDWSEADAPYVTVARVTVPQQDPDSADGKALADEVDRLRFDPWSALASHRPLGAIMRARKPAYLASQKGRGVA